MRSSISNQTSCAFQEVRDYESVQQLIEVLPRFHAYVVSRFRERIGDILGIQQTAICGTRHAGLHDQRAGNAVKVIRPAVFI